MRVQEYSHKSWAPVFSKIEQNLMERTIKLLQDLISEGDDRDWELRGVAEAHLYLTAIYANAVKP